MSVRAPASFAQDLHELLDTIAERRSNKVVDLSRTEFDVIGPRLGKQSPRAENPTSADVPVLARPTVVEARDRPEVEIVVFFDRTYEYRAGTAPSISTWSRPWISVSPLELRLPRRSGGM